MSASDDAKETLRVLGATLLAARVAGCALFATTPPILDAHGITLGQTTPTEARDWAEASGLRCTLEPARRRATSRYVCVGDLEAAMPEAGFPTGQQGRLLMVYAEGGPVHHLSIYRQHSLPHLAAADFVRRRDHISAAHGAPARADAPPDAELFGAVLGRRAATWSMGSPSVSLSAAKTGGPYVAITESWQVPPPERSGGTAHASTTGATWKPAATSASTRP